VQRVKADFKSAPVSPKLKALLAIAGKVQRDGKLVTAEDVERARHEGASDVEIHDTVLIAAAFCMYNRYVDGLDTWQPRENGMYAQMGQHLAEHGYLKSSR
jgi:alkylhydroperoxidase family enzyme